uniref:PUR2 protein n=1 Tax=Junco hyemalis TaxID=40217 RepID=A0A8C5NK69_JUNHY
MAERVLVVGSGGREHALAWKLAQSPHVKHVFVAPGNAGTADNGKISNSAVLVSNHTIVTQFCKDHNIGLVVVGPEALLACGEHPGAKWRFLWITDFPAWVVRARGPAARREVTIAASKEEACRAVQEIMQDRMFGEMVVIEELLQGEELSCSCFTDGVTVACMPPAQPHKRLLDGEQGPSTAGMGAYCPVPQVRVTFLLCPSADIPLTQGILPHAGPGCFPRFAVPECGKGLIPGCCLQQHQPGHGWAKFPLVQRDWIPSCSDRVGV